jgi:hypothetical protein
MQRTGWDDIIDALSTWETVSAKAKALLSQSEPALACMLLRDVLLRDSKFMYSAEFSDICQVPALHGYLSGPEYEELKIADKKRFAAQRLTTNTATEL